MRLIRLETQEREREHRIWKLRKGLLKMVTAILRRKYWMSNPRL